MAAPKKKPAGKRSGAKKPPAKNLAKSRKNSQKAATKKAVKKPAKRSAGKRGKGKAKPAKTPRGPRLTAAQQSVRDSLLLTRVNQGWTIEKAAKEAGISLRAAKGALKAKRAIAENLLDKDVVAIIESFLEELRVSVGDFDLIAAEAMDKNQLAVAVGAKKGANEAREKLLILLQSVGAVPHDLGTMTHLIDVRAVVVEINSAVQEFFGAVTQLGLPKEKQAAVTVATGKLNDRLDQIASAPQAAQRNGEDPDGDT